MYLNTGGIHPQINSGEKWYKWQAILINDNMKNVYKGFIVPDSASFTIPIETNPSSFTDVQWHHCEWSNHPYFAAATINVDRYFPDENNQWKNTYYQERIYLINLKDSTYLEVLHADTIKYYKQNNDDSGYYWPFLWAELPTGFTENPAWLKPY
jgi:hypothetical protein